MVATSVGRGHSLARSLHGWLWDFLEDSDQLPFSLYCGSMSRIEDEDLASEIHNHLESLGKKYLSAMDVILLWVESEGRPESEVRRRVGVGLTEYTEEGNG